MKHPLRALGVNLVLLGAWAALHADSVQWLVRRWLATEGQLHLVLAGLLLLWAGRSVDPVAVLDGLARPVSPRIGPLLCAAVPPLVAALITHRWPIHAVDGVALVLSGYGMVGLFVSASRWRALLGAAGLAAALLPLTEHLDVFLGFPLRAATAQAVAAVLGRPELTSSTVLAVDGSFAHVDLPCSGVRSLWSGLVVLLGAAAAWSRPVDARFGGIALLTGVALGVANATRVAILVLVQHELGLPLVAEVLHLPLGVLGFMGAMGVGLGLVSRVPQAAVRSVRTWHLPTWTVGLIGLAWLGAWLVPDAPAPVPVATEVSLPVDVTGVPVRPEEAAFAARHGGLVVKGRVARGALNGTVVVVHSRHWMAHHVPTWCLQSAGWELSGEHPERSGDAPVRVADAVRRGADATAVWWFQSADTLTDDHTQRIAQGLSDDAPWVLVSVLLDGPVDVADPAAMQLLDDLRAAVRPSLEIP